LSRLARVTAGSTSIASLLLWLILAALVAVVGAALLEYEQVGQSLPSALWALAVLIGEVVLYLLVLTALSSGRMGTGQAFAGTVLGLVARAALSVVTAELPIVSRSGAGGFLDSFVYFYSLYWPGVAVQICAVSIFLLRLREAWTVNNADEEWGGLETQFDGDEPEDLAERQRVLLAALKESDEPGQAQPADQQGTEGAGFYEDVGSSLSLTLPFEQPGAEEIAEDFPGGEDESANDTSPIAVVTEEYAEKLTEQQTMGGSEAQPFAPEPAGDQLLPGYLVSGITPFAGGVLVWGGEFAVDDVKLSQAVAGLLVAASALGQAGGIGPVELLLVEAECGCWALSAGLERDDWWVGLMQAAGDSPGAAAVAVREAVARVQDAEILPEMSYPDAHLKAGVSMGMQVVFHPLADSLLEQWGLQLSLGEADDEPVLTALPLGADAAGVAGRALPLWQASEQLSDVTQWQQVQTVLVGGKVAAAAVGRASWQGRPAVLAVSSRDTVRLGAARVLLTQLARKLDDFGPQYRPSNRRTSQDSTA